MSTLTATKDAALARQLWDRYGDLTLGDIPADARTVAGHCVLDWLGCALAGSRERLSQILRRELGAQPGPASILGTPQSTTATAAALLNGAAGHALDYDDTHTTMGGHPTAPVFPAAFALAQELGSSGAELLAAFVIGVEVETRIGAVVGGVAYSKGWHSTSSIGVFGAAAAACRLLGADHQQFGRAIGLAGSQASGLKANFGTMTKPFHAGMAAERGLFSAKLAMGGFTANPAVIEGGQGYADAAGEGASALRWEELEKHRGRWLIEDTLFKYHAACYLTHAAIEAAASLRPELATDRVAPEVDPEDVSAAVVTVYPSLLDVCGIARPTTGLEAKFSLAATTALALLGADTSDPALFARETLEESRLQSLIERVEIRTDEELRPTQSTVRLHARDKSYEAFHDAGVPATDLQQQGRKLEAKFRRLAGRLLGQEETERLAETALGLANLPEVRELMGQEYLDR